MTEVDILELLRASNEAIESNFQFWLSSSFAVLMAFFFAGEKVTGYIKWVVVSLYVVSTILFTYRLISSGLVAVRARAALEDMQSEFLVIGSSTANNFIGGSFMLIILLGTIATVYFCIFSKKLTAS